MYGKLLLTCVDHGPYPFLVLALTLNLYSVLSSRLAKTVLRSVVLRMRFSSGATAFQNWMSYMVIWRRKRIYLVKLPIFLFIGKI